MYKELIKVDNKGTKSPVLKNCQNQELDKNVNNESEEASIQLISCKYNTAHLFPISLSLQFGLYKGLLRKSSIWLSHTNFV